MSAPLSRADWRRLVRLADANESSLLADRRFFERWPERHHRIRLSSAAEIESLKLLGEGQDAPAGYCWYTAVRQVVPDVRIRSFVVWREGAETDVAEPVAAMVFDRASNSWPALSAFTDRIREDFAGGAR